MSPQPTAEQQRVIDAPRQNILVSAAAGSGKTTVLVERIISMVTGCRPGCSPWTSCWRCRVSWS